MYLIEKIVIKDGVAADTTVTINKYTGEVDAINTLLAHPNIPNTRGIATYTIVGNKPTFNFSGVGANEMWIYVNGVGFKTGGITSIEIDQSIKLVPYHISGVYAMPNEDKNRILVVADDSNISEVNINNLEEEESVCIQNDRSVTIQAVKLIGGAENYFQIFPYESAYFRNVSEDIVMNNYIKVVNSNRNIYPSGLSTTNLTVQESDYKNTDDITVIVRNLTDPCNVNIPSWSKIGREIKIINLGGNFATFTVPSGHTCYAGSFPSTITSGKFISLFLVEPTKWAYYQS